jgi:hypothetical protein
MLMINPVAATMRRRCRPPVLLELRRRRVAWRGESTTMPVMMHMRRWRAIGRVRGERRGRVSVATLVRRIRMVGRIHRGWRQLVMRWVRALWAWRWGNNRNTARHGLGLA